MTVIGKAKYLDWLTDDGLLRIEGWAREGLTNEQISHNMGINTKTLWEWERNYPQISNALKKGKAPVDIQVENALHKRALGYRTTETVTETEFICTGTDENGKPIYEERIKSCRTIVKEVPPDTGAIAFWLKNRRPDRWKEKREEQIQVTAADYSLLDEVRKAAEADG